MCYGDNGDNMRMKMIYYNILEFWKFYEKLQKNREFNY